MTNQSINQTEVDFNQRENKFYRSSSTTIIARAELLENNNSEKMSPSTVHKKHHHQSSSSRTTQMAMAFLLLLISSQIVTSAPMYDYENLRDLYEILLRQENPNMFVHQMERKGGRSPTLRLRFGRRSDPLWAPSSSKLPASISNSRDGDDNVLEKVPYK